MHGGEERTRLYSYSSSLPLFTVFFSVSHSLSSLYSTLSLPYLLFFLFSRCSSTSEQESPLKRGESAEPDGTNKNTEGRSILSRNEIFIARLVEGGREGGRTRRTTERVEKSGGGGGRMKGKINQTAYQAASLIVVKIDRRLYIPGPLARI